MPHFLLFDVFCEVCQLHVALARQRVVHGEGGRQVVTRLSHLRDLQVVPQQLLVVGMSTVLDDALGTLCRRLATQVGNTLLGDDDVDIVLGRVLMADERYNRRDDATLSHRRTRKYR